MVRPDWILLTQTTVHGWQNKQRASSGALYSIKDKRMVIDDNETKEETILRFNKKWDLDKETKCWVWQGTPKSSFKFRGKSWIIPRLSYTLFNREIEGNDIVKRTCETKCCVNPDHLACKKAKEKYIASEVKQKGHVKPVILVKGDIDRRAELISMINEVHGGEIALIEDSPECLKKATTVSTTGAQLRKHFVEFCVEVFEGESDLLIASNIFQTEAEMRKYVIYATEYECPITILDSSEDLSKEQVVSILGELK
jgi:hypothetical protein